MKIELDKIWDDYYDFTGRISAIIRQLNFAGIAVCWIFCRIEKHCIEIPFMIRFSLALFSLSFIFELTQYLYSANNLHRTALALEQKKENNGYIYRHNVIMSERLFDYKIYTSVVAYALVVFYVLVGII